MADLGLQEELLRTKDKKEMPLDIPKAETTKNYSYTKIISDKAAAAMSAEDREQLGSNSEEMLVQSEQKEIPKRRHHHRPSKIMTFAIIVMITGFTLATPLSLFLTIPAYILADKAEVVYQKGEKRSRRYKCLKYSSVALMVTTVLLAIAAIVMIIMIYILIVYPQMYH